jgi:hypothetical protein
MYGTARRTQHTVAGSGKPEQSTTTIDWGDLSRRETRGGRKPNHIERTNCPKTEYSWSVLPFEEEASSMAKSATPNNEAANTRALETVMAPQQPISIISAGIGGLSLARCLLKRNIPTIVYESLLSNPRHIYAITLHQSSYQPLLDVLEMDELNFKRHLAVDGTIGGNGSINPKLLIQKSASSSTSFRANRQKLEELFREGLDV